MHGAWTKLAGFNLTKIRLHLKKQTNFKIPPEKGLGAVGTLMPQLNLFYGFFLRSFPQKFRQSSASIKINLGSFITNFFICIKSFKILIGLDHNFEYFHVNTGLSILTTSQTSLYAIIFSLIVGLIFSFNFNPYSELVYVILRLYTHTFSRNSSSFIRN